MLNIVNEYFVAIIVDFITPIFGDFHLIKIG